MLVALVPLLVLIVGILLWALASNAIVKDAGRWMFVCGLLVTLLVMAQKTIAIP